MLSLARACYVSSVSFRLQKPSRTMLSLKGLFAMLGEAFVEEADETETVAKRGPPVRTPCDKSRLGAKKVGQMVKQEMFFFQFRINDAVFRQIKPLVFLILMLTPSLPHALIPSILLIFSLRAFPASTNPCTVHSSFLMFCSVCFFVLLCISHLVQVNSSRTLQLERRGNPCFQPCLERDRLR